MKINLRFFICWLKGHEYEEIPTKGRKLKRALKITKKCKRCGKILIYHDM